MGQQHTAYFGFKVEPFANDLNPKNLLKLPGMISVKERMDYILNLGGVMVVTGDVGSGKSTSLRFSKSHHHSSAVLILDLVANSGSLSEFYKQLCWSLDLTIQSSSRAFLLKTFKQTLSDIVSTKKQKVVLVVDEANLLRPEVLAELHTMTQFENDSKNLISVVLAGQSNLLDKLTFRTSAPLASRVIARTHLTSINQDQMHEYLKHHLQMSGVKKMLFADEAVTAIHQGSGGLLRRANSLARGGLVAAAIEKEELVSAEHIRMASSELI